MNLIRYISGLSAILTLFLAISAFAQATNTDTTAARFAKFKQELPNHVLAVDFVVARALDSADSFKVVKSDMYSVPALELQAESIYDTRVSLSQSWLRNKNESNNANSPDDIVDDTTALSVSKYFPTGTGIAIGAEQGYNEIGFPTGSFINIDPYYESKASISLSQNLWADSFGYSSRKTLHAARLNTEARKLGLMDNVSQWTIAIVNQFYYAWFSQTQAVASREGLKRRERLLKTMKVRLDRGTAEKPDYLQVESAYYLSKAKKLDSEKTLDDQWRKLILLLKLPADWMEFDTVDIPLQIDDPIKDAVQLCEGFRKKGVPAEENINVKRAELMFEAATAQWDSAKNSLWPELKLQGSYFLNGIDKYAGETVQEVSGEDNPGWSVGLVFTMPLGMSAQKSKISLATADKMKAEAMKSIARDERDLAWLNECANLDRLTETLSDARKAKENQAKRADLEERRFQLGRSTTFNVIQAGDDETEAEIFLKSVEVQTRQSAWAILNLAGKIKGQLETYVKKFGGEMKLEPTL